MYLSEHFHCSLDYLLRGKETEDLSSSLPSCIIEILRSNDQDERDLLLTYLDMYTKIRKTPGV